ncbi:hypothetical protein, partial [Pseudomonas aeruginosa]
MATVLPFDAAGIHLDPAQGLARQLYAALRVAAEHHESQEEAAG